MLFFLVVHKHNQEGCGKQYRTYKYRSYAHEFDEQITADCSYDKEPNDSVIQPWLVQVFLISRLKIHTQILRAASCIAYAHGCCYRIAPDFAEGLDLYAAGEGYKRVRNYIIFGRDKCNKEQYDCFK